MTVAALIIALALAAVCVLGVLMSQSTTPPPRRRPK